MNATLSERRAKDAEERGRKEEQAKRMEVAALEGRARASMAANGVDTTWGSPLAAITDIAVLGELDALTIRRNSAWEAYDHRTAAANGRADAGLARANASNSMTAGYLDSASTVLGGASSAYRGYRDYTRPAIG